jgi:hypothetical protein
MGRGTDATEHDFAESLTDALVAAQFEDELASPSVKRAGVRRRPGWCKAEPRNAAGAVVFASWVPRLGVRSSL